MENKKLDYTYKHILEVDNKCEKKANTFCEGYKEFISNNKTEREVTKYIINYVKKAGYIEYVKGKTKIKKGDKIYINNRNKSVVLLTIGNNLLDGIHFVVSHIDSPRLDLKANPLYESDDMGYFKTHYYGGIRKYQWTTIPLSMHGKIFLDGEKSVDLCIGEDENDTKFVITDLLPHLSYNQDERKLREGIKGEELNILVGSYPIITNNKEVKEKVKYNILQILNKKYNIKEKDFVRAEIEFTPAEKATDIGFDRSMISAYGQDDRVCAYPSLLAEVEAINPSITSCTVFTDKEEIGSEGDTGMVSNFLFDIIEDICDDMKVKARDVYRKSICFSSDVNSAYDPTWADVFEKRNSSLINRGVVVTKYTGARGKSGSNDASAETMAKVIDMLDKKKVVWQTGELGRVDIGGSGTIAKFMSQRNIDTVDIGVAVLSMHAPYEVVSKLDIYHTYLAYKAFINSKL